MSIRCRFLEPSQYGPACAVGVNFRALGEDCALCQACAVPALDASVRCKHLQVYTILTTSGKDRTVKVPLGCAFHRSGLDDLTQCQGCPACEAV